MAGKKKARTTNVQDQLVTWFSTVLIPAMQPQLRSRYAKFGPTPLPRHPHRTPYLEDAAGQLERIIPSSDWDWTEKHGDDEFEPDPVIWTAEPTYDTEGNQLTPGNPKHGWLQDPQVDANNFIVVPGVPDPNGSVTEYNWLQAWRAAGFDVTAFPQSAILEGCPDPTTGEWVNTIRLDTESRPPVFDGAGSMIEPAEFKNTITMRVRYTIAGERTNEAWEEFSWWDRTIDDGQTWENGVSSDWVEVYRGPTQRGGA